MSLLLRQITFTCALAVTGLCAAEEQPTSLVFRTEVHPIATIDLTTQQTLAGQTDGPARTIAGELRLPVTTDTRVPAVILMHGDAAALANQAVWSAVLNSIGVAVFSVDSFSGRGAIARTTGITVEGGGAIGSTARTVDAYRALSYLAKHPRIDTQRIVLMGFSSGGRVVLNSAMKRFAQPHAPADAAFAGFIALYPTCNVRLKEDTALVSAPLRIHHGEADIITRSEACRSYVERLRAAGQDAEIVEYKGARHGYDNPAGISTAAMAQAVNPSRCQFEEDGKGLLVNAEPGKPVTLTDTCIGWGLTGGHDAQAAAATHTAVKAFLRQLFKLGS